jgi:hypothetical protein
LLVSGHTADGDDDFGALVKGFDAGNVHWETEGHLELAARGTASVEKVLSVAAPTNMTLQIAELVMPDIGWK